MKLFPPTRFLPVIASLVALTTSQTTLADNRPHNRNSWTHNPAYQQTRNHGSYRNHHDDNRRFLAGSRFHNGYASNYRSASRYSHDNWSVSLNLGSGYSSSSVWYGTGLYSGGGYGVSYRDRDWYAFPSYRTRSTVVVNSPTVVYVDDPSPESVRVIERPAHSLLRDINGNCFDRSYDRYGVETRVRLPASACRF